MKKFLTTCVCALSCLALANEVIDNYDWIHFPQVNYNIKLERDSMGEPFGLLSNTITHLQYHITALTLTNSIEGEEGTYPIGHVFAYTYPDNFFQTSQPVKITIILPPINLSVDKN